MSARRYVFDDAGLHRMWHCISTYYTFHSHSLTKKRLCVRRSAGIFLKWENTASAPLGTRDAVVMSINIRGGPSGNELFDYRNPRRTQGEVPLDVMGPSTRSKV